ncbi:MAG: SNF2-related protein, partial [Oscillospiraceae bacterium]|nr:SNF2-related protein [Oscillospiraceae bacterium]
LTASEISVRLGATWLNPDYYRQFIFETLGTPRSAQWSIKVHYSKITGEWRIEGKNQDRGNVKAYNTYGTKRANAYEIIEDSLNLKDVRIFDYQYDANGSKTAVLNKKETAIAQSKQELLKEAFAEWLWKDPDRRETICEAYNILFNSNRPREYDGSHISFSGMNPEITLRRHQVNAIAHIMYGGNTLLAHVVGAGKTFEMVAAAMESKRLGLCQKSLFVVPNHLTEQWATEFLQLYPAANILVATKKDFETKNRKRFCGRIATGEYDAVIIGHSQFEKIPMSVERQRAILEQQMDEILLGINEAKREHAENFTVKQMEKTRKGLQAKIDKLNDQSRKDDVVTFEELGCDRLFVDESHGFKNLFCYTKMRNVGGVAQTEAQKSSDLFMKCRYLDELTGGRGIVFATGTPISNSMVELYTIQRYLQMKALQEQGLQHFDSWAANYGETVTAIELSPEGTGYRAKTRFAKFYNLPELMSVFKNVADIQTADMLKLPVPEAHYHNVALKPSEYQKEMVASLAERAEKVRNREVDSSVDNMLLITNDGRKLALDQRLVNPMLPDDPESKAAKCAENVFEIWQRTAAQRSTQMIFCDLSTPSGARPIEMVMDGDTAKMAPFQNVYEDIAKKLLAMGIPESEIAFIHNAKSEAQKKDLFGKVRSGQVRVLLGSTARMGAGTNCQQKLVALHHVDCPWRPSDLQQREGRIIRQGNENPEVDIYSYVTEGTFDAYLYQLVESKQKFISQIMTSKSPVRSAEDVDEQSLSYAEIKALASGNPQIKEKMDLDIEVSKLKLLKSNHLSQRYALEDAISKTFPVEIAEQQARLTGYGADIATVTEHTHPNAEGFSPMTLAGTTYAEKKDAGGALLALCQTMVSPEATQIGSYRGLTLELSFDSFAQEYRLTMIGQLRHMVTLGTDVFGNLQRMDNYLETLPVKEQTCRERLGDFQTQMETAKFEVQQPFAREEELKAKTARLEELNALLNMDNKALTEPEQTEKPKDKEMER